jgi:xylulokinase
MHLLGLDVGTTGTKAIVFDEEGHVCASAYREYPFLHPRPGWSDLNSERVWQAVVEAVREAAGRSPGPVRALSISSQGEAATPVSAAGEVLAPAIVSFCSRTQDLVPWWRERIDPLDLFRITGMPLSHIYTILKLQWLREHEPALFRRIHKFLLFEDFTIAKMGLPPTIDYSLAARTMAFDVVAKRWAERVFTLADLDPALFADARPSGTVVGELPRKSADLLGLPPGCLVVTGGHDQPAGALGAGVIRSGIAIDATGTVECLTPAFAEPVLTEAMMNSGFSVYPHTAPGLYCTIAFNFTGGSLLRWYRDTLGEAERAAAQAGGRDVYDVILEQMPAEPTDLLVLPYFTSTGTPYFDPAPTSVILGLHLGTTRGQIIRALLEGLTFEIRLNIELLAEAGIHLKELRAVGGGAKSDRWLQLKADIFNRPVTSLEASEAACLGVALLAGTAAGVYRSLDEAVAATVRPVRTYEPDPGRAAFYQDRLALYRSLYPLTRELTARHTPRE